MKIGCFNIYRGKVHVANNKSQLKYFIKSRLRRHRRQFLQKWTINDKPSLAVLSLENHLENL